jgi:hypothetical protein
VESPSKQKKLKAAKKAEKRAAYPPSAARCVGRTHQTPTDKTDDSQQALPDNILPSMKTLAMDKKDYNPTRPVPCQFPIK